MQCLWSNLGNRDYRTRMLSLWLRNKMFWVSKQRFVEQANIMH